MKWIVPLGIGLASALVAGALGLLGAFEGLDRMLLDARIAARAEPDVAGRVGVVVATDDDLDVPEIPDMQAWPWDRSVHGQLVLCLREAGASAVGLDFLLDGVGRSAEGDGALSEAARSSGRVTVGSTFELHGPRGAKPTSTERVERHSLPAPAGSRFPLAARALLPYESLNAAVERVAFLNAPPEGDGKTRRVWLFLEYQGRLFPSFALATYLAHVGKSLADVRVESDGGVHLPRADGSHVEVPLDDAGRLLLDPARMGAFPVRAYVDVFSRYQEQGAEGLKEYAGRPVLVGQVMTGSSDIQASSREPQVYGVFLQAAALAQLMDARFLHEGSTVMSLLGLVVLCLAGAWAGSRLRGAWQALPATLLLAVPLGLAFLLARTSGFVPPLGALLAGGLLAWAVAAVARAVRDTRHRRRVEAVFQGFLPRPVLAQVLADPLQAWMRPQRREGVLLLARVDRQDSGRLAPEEDASLLDDLLGTAVRILGGAGGTVVRLDLDRVAAVFGAPAEMQDPGGAAARATLALREAWQQANARWVDRMGAPLSSRFALHAGVFTVGAIGTDQHREYAVFGPEVPVGLALLDEAAPGQVLLSERCQALVAAALETSLVGRTPEGRGLYELVVG